VTSLKTLVTIAVALAALFPLAGCNPSADLIPDAPAADEIPPFDPESLQLFFTLNVGQATSLLKNNPDAVIIDVRNADAFAEGHLPGALNFDVKSEGFRHEIDTLDRGTKILVYGGGESQKDIRTTDSAITRMKVLGFRNIYRITGGIEAWIDRGHPFVRDLPDPAGIAPIEPIEPVTPPASS